MKTLALVVVWSAMVQTQLVTATGATKVIEARLGSYMGSETTAINNEKYWSFRGIPYAKPPLGQLRFAKPERLPYQGHFNGVLDATRQGAACPQNSYFLSPNEKVSEDCLTLNIFVKNPKYATINAKKVLVWIHGGAYLFGSSFIYDAGNLVTEHDVIVVTIHYRLGVLGFLSTEDEASPGNYGLWDQALAIEWVKANIRDFGGDPDDIAIAGESAGAASVSTLSISPYTDGLFTKAYSHSGSATSLFSRYTDAKGDAFLLAKSLNCTKVADQADLCSTASKALIQCLRTKPADVLVPPPELLRSTFVPRVDGDFIPRPPIELLRDSRYLQSVGFYRRKYLVAINNNEMSAIEPRYAPAKANFYASSNLTTSAKDALWRYFAVNGSTAERLEVAEADPVVADAVGSWYEDRYPGESGYTQIVYDLHFTIPTFDVLNAVALNRASSAWLLYFNHYPSFMRGERRGMIHALDLVYWFDISTDVINSFVGAGAIGTYSKDEMRLKKLYSSIVAAFIKTGNPTSPLRGITTNPWYRYDQSDAPYLDFNSKPEVLTHLARSNRILWEKTVPNLVSDLQDPEHRSDDRD
ncbi:unnamed protein product [Lymnaea stagnalis]|uniref:Carboxylic ester hydrolase n=1 Tax=Lymnaea stagnalis TaxID=6523 RepID=A0AAV2HJC4_LYMST